jgi:2-methylcitrate dehydratase PrpD
MTATVAWQGAAMPPTDPDGPTGRLSTWLRDLRLEDAPAETRERAKDILLDGIGCALVGAQLPWSKIAVEAATRFEGRGERTLIGWGRTAPATVAALLNGTFIQGFELDDFHPMAPLHSASLLLPALIACAEERGGVSGARFLLAAIAGFEVGPRVGLALHGAQMLSRGWHSGAVFGTYAAAAAAGVLLDLDASRFEDAFGLAGTQSAGLMAAQYEAMCKRMHHGFAARNGLFAALMAAGGYTGIKRVFERDYGGFLSVFGEGHDPRPDEIARDLGERWETHRIVLKPYAAMGALHAPLDAIFDIAARRALKPGEIAHIDIYMSHAAYHHGWWVLERPVTPIGAQMNVAYAVAAAILDGAAMVQQFSPQRIDQDDIWALIPKIAAHHDPAYDAGPGTRGAARMVVQLTDGQTLETVIPVSRTMSEPMDRARAIAKFRALTDSLVEPERQDRIIGAVLDLERLADVSALIEPLAAPVGAAFS